MHSVSTTLVESLSVKRSRRCPMLSSRRRTRTWIHVSFTLLQRQLLQDLAVKINSVALMTKVLVDFATVKEKLLSWSQQALIWSNTPVAAFLIATSWNGIRTKPFPPKHSRYSPFYSVCKWSSCLFPVRLLTPSLSCDGVDPETRERQCDQVRRKLSTVAALCRE